MDRPAIPREPRIDILRGFSILVILVNHLSQVVEFGGLRGWMIPTPTQFGYSTAAELFVMMSGYMVGLVYLSRPQPMIAILRRARTLWKYDAVLLAIVAPLILVMPLGEQQFWRLEDFAAAPLAATFRFLTLQDAPRLLDILQLYIKLMLLAPLAIWVHRRSPRALIAVSAGLYVAAQILTILRLSAHPDANTDGWLDLMSWQMLFFVPMALGAMRAHLPLFRRMERNWAMLAVLIALFAAGAIARHLEAASLFDRPMWISGRSGLHVLRLGHAVMMLLLYASALTMASRYLNRQPLRAIAAVGRHSLKCFSAGVIATYALGTLWLRLSGGYPAYYLFAAIATGMTLGLATLLDQRKLRTAASGGAARPVRHGDRSAQPQ